MYGKIEGSYMFTEFDISREGWVMLESPIDGTLFIAPAEDDDASSGSSSDNHEDSHEEDEDVDQESTVYQPLNPLTSLSSRLEYNFTVNVPGGGLRIRRAPNTSSDHIGSLTRGRRSPIWIARVDESGNWGKLHPSMYSSIEGSYNYERFDIARDGWVMIQDPITRVVYLEPAMQSIPFTPGPSMVLRRNSRTSSSRSSSSSDENSYNDQTMANTLRALMNTAGSSSNNSQRTLKTSVQSKNSIAEQIEACKSVEECETLEATLQGHLTTLSKRKVS
jgi:hypothetical protein